ncbi:glycosyl hydrolase family 95 catalytic domain-containing protein [Ancylomarina longa]|uniref:Glycoside hydrolase family 65 protein n=1 Tax=Ancylomarina longa TaxID=2487017 RepID=A0A434AG51_9BACT|nr:glycoside hydrolase family 65 protein [Ancylomarina longa]RUT73376.1 glycoside hydrolase family 65 protein [Ancylomarina longa]
MKTSIFLSMLFMLCSNLLMGNGYKNSGWHIYTESKENYNGVTLANGRIGIVTDQKIFNTKEIVINGVYDKEFEGGVSQMLQGIIFTNLELHIDGEKVTNENISNWSQDLNMKEASITTSFSFKNKANINYTILAMRNLPYAAMVILNVEPLKDIKLEVFNHMGIPEELKEAKTNFNILKDGEIEMPIFQTTAKSRFKKHELAASNVFLFDDEKPEYKVYNMSGNRPMIGFSKILKKQNKFRCALVGAECTSGDFNDPKSESERFAIYALRQNIDDLLNQHKKLWAKIWENDIIIEGDMESQRDVRMALYSLFSFSRKNTRLSISPMGLSSHKGYNGHIFWDSEIWMYPPLLAFDQDIAKTLLDYRFDRLEKAKEKAANYGFKGAMFPWESDDTGEEATPTWALTGTFEQHITADVGIAFWNYFLTTGDKTWLKLTGFPVLKEVADFWISRVRENEDGTFSIINVVGADEFAPNVDDNAFTNGSVKVVLKYATKAAQELEIVPNEQWMKVSDNIKFHYFANGVMKEHANYKGEIIKQADVNLLTYPLAITTKEDLVRKELNYYEPKISKECPAMAHAVLSVINARLGYAKEAFRLFKQGYVPNRRPPFGVLSESANSNNPYFATGAGGMLQAVLFGFGGLRITENGIVQENPCLPKEWKKLTIKGIGINNEIFVVE